MEGTLEFYALLGTVVVGFFGLIGTILLHLREMRKMETAREEKAESRLQTLAEGRIASALEERGIERRVERHDDLLQRHADDHRSLEKELAAMMVRLPIDFVRREDWLIGQSRIERKMDSIGEHVHDILKRLPTEK